MCTTPGWDEGWVHTVGTLFGGNNWGILCPGYGLVRFPTGAGNSSLHHRVQPALGPTQPPSQWIEWALSLRLNRQQL